MKKRPQARRAAYRRPMLSLSERQRLRGQVSEDEGYLRTLNGPPRGADALTQEAWLPPANSGRSVQAGAIEARLRRTRAALDRLDPANHRLTGVARQRAFQEMKQHEEFLRKKMLSTYDMGAYPKADNVEKDHNYRRAVDKSAAQEVGSAEFRARARRYKELARVLDPENSELSNIERFRPRCRY